MRLGCKTIEEVPNQNYGRQYLSNKCSLSNLGSPKLSSCELENIVTNTEIQNPAVVRVPAGDLAKGRWNVLYGREKQIEKYLTRSGQPYYTAYARPISLNGIEYDIQNVFFIGSQSGLTKAENFILLTYIKCRKWHGNRFF